MDQFFRKINRQLSKRIIICCDGTWDSPRSDSPTNVLKLARAISPMDSDEKKQVVFYYWGVGSDRWTLLGGLFGVGLDKNIRDAYRFIVHNYEIGDELFLFGFSRGSFTVRSLAGFIYNIGILRRLHADKILDAYHFYRNEFKPNAAESIDYRQKYSVTYRTEIKFMGIWDTVGSLGIPVSFVGFKNTKFRFHDTDLSPIILCARHAVSIDEQRKNFRPVLWNSKSEQNVRQVWFAGVHADVGGGYQTSDLSDITLKWMIGEAAAQGLSVEDHLNTNLKPDSLGAIHESHSRWWKLLGKLHRTIGSGEEDYLHNTVKIRYATLDDYQPSNLKAYVLKHRWHNLV